MKMQTNIELFPFKETLRNALKNMTDGLSAGKGEVDLLKEDLKELTKLKDQLSSENRDLKEQLVNVKKEITIFRNLPILSMQIVIVYL